MPTKTKKTLLAIINVKKHSITFSILIINNNVVIECDKKDLDKIFHQNNELTL